MEIQVLWYKDLYHYIVFKNQNQNPLISQRTLCSFMLDIVNLFNPGDYPGNFSSRWAQDVKTFSKNLFFFFNTTDTIQASGAHITVKHVKAALKPWNIRQLKRDRERQAERLSVPSSITVWHLSNLALASHEGWMTFLLYYESEILVFAVRINTEVWNLVWLMREAVRKQTLELVRTDSITVV